MPATLSPAQRTELLRTVRAQAERLQADGAPLRQVLSQLTSAIEVLSSHRTVASILLLDGEGLLRNGASPSLPADYLDAIDRLRPDANLGTCAAAAATGQRVLTRSFMDDGKWAELKHLPLAIGFHGAWSQPLVHEGRVVGTFGTYFREPRDPTDAEIDAVTYLAPVAARAIHEAMAPGH